MDACQVFSVSMIVLNVILLGIWIFLLISSIIANNVLGMFLYSIFIAITSGFLGYAIWSLWHERHKVKRIQPDL